MTEKHTMSFSVFFFCCCCCCCCYMWKTNCDIKILEQRTSVAMIKKKKTSKAKQILPIPAGPNGKGKQQCLSMQCSFFFSLAKKKKGKSTMCFHENRNKRLSASC